MSSVRERLTPAARRSLTLVRPRSPHRWGDPLVVGAVALVVYALHGYDGALDRDLGVFSYGGLQVSRGGTPYVDVFNSVGPLADAVPGSAMWLGHLVGADPVLSARLFFTVLSALCCALLCVLARDTLGTRAAGYVAPAVFLTFGGFLHLASDGPREKTTMVLFLLGCLVLLGRRRWALAGACAAMATLAWQPVFAVTVAAVVAAVLLDQRDTRRRVLIRFIVGGLVPSAATVAYFLGVGAFRQAWDGFVLVNVRYTQQPSMLTRPDHIAAKLWTAYHWTLPLAMLGIVAVVGLGLRAVPLARRPTVSTQARRVAVCAAGGLAATLWTVLVVNGGPDLFVMLPFAALGIAGGALELLRRLPRRAAAIGAALVVSVGVLAAGVESVATRHDELVLQRADVAAVLGTQPSNATVVSLSAPQVLALSGRTSPTPYQIMSPNQERYLAARYPGGLAGFVDTLSGIDPTFVAVGATAHVAWAESWLHADFRRIGGGAGWQWYLNRDAGQTAYTDAQVVHDEVVTAYGG